MTATARQCAITLLPNKVEMCFWCLHIGFSHPGNQFRAVITCIINISQSYGGKTNVAPGKRHIVGLCNNNNLFNMSNKVIISHLEAQGNKRTGNIRHAVKMFRLLTKNILWLLITVRHKITCRSPYICSRPISMWPMWYPPASCFYSTVRKKAII